MSGIVPTEAELMAAEGIHNPNSIPAGMGIAQWIAHCTRYNGRDAEEWARLQQQTAFVVREVNLRAEAAEAKVKELEAKLDAVKQRIAAVPTRDETELRDFIIGNLFWLSSCTREKAEKWLDDAIVTHTRPMRPLDRLVRRWEGAKKRYNYDCNTRQAKPGDAARNRLRIAAEMAFERMMDELKAVIAANDGGQRP